MSSLLDVFVDVGARGLPQTEQDLQDFINRITAAFGTLNTNTTVSVLNAGKNAGKKAAASVVSQLREEILKFEQQKFEFDFQVRLLGDAGVRRELADIQSEVSAAKREFALATDDSGRQAAIDRVKAAQQELAILEKQVEATRAVQGLAAPSIASGEREKVFTQIRADAAALNLELQLTQKLIGRAADPKLANSFDQTAEQAKRINLELQNAIRNKDFIRAEAALQQLRALTAAISAARSAAESQINLKIQIPDLKNEFKAVTIALNQALQSGSIGSLKVLDASDRQEAIAYRSEITALIAEFNRLGSQAEVTADDILEMQKIIQQLSLTNPAAGPVRGLLDLEAKTGKVSRSFNSLNNDAYQFGQLIEDAAIGFELNGIAGALRGAGNNASFLLQNFIANEVAAKQLSFRAGLILTTLSSIGVAAAMIIIPRMIEWLNSLDDIEIKVRDIADMLKREFSDARLQVSLELDQESEARTLREVEDAIEGIQALIDRAQDRDDLQLKISAVLDNQSVQTLFRQATDATQQIADAARGQIASIEAQAQTIANRAAARGGRFQDFRQFLTPDQQDQIKELGDLATAASEFNDLRERIFEDSKRGVVDPVALETARDSLQSVIDGLELLKGKVSQEDAKILEANIAAARDEMERLNEDAQKLQAILDSDAQAMEALKDSAKEVSDELQLMAAVLEGSFGAEETVLFDIEKQKQQFAEAAQELIDLKGATDEVINTLEALAQKTQVEIVIKGETELKKLNDDLVDLSVKIKDINEEIAEAAVEAAKKQQDAQAKAAEKIADLQARLQDIATKKAFDGRRAAIQAEIDLLRSQLDEFQPDQFEAGTLGTAIGGVGSNQIESQISALEMQLKNLEFAQRQAEEAKQIADINKQIAETQNKMAEELKKIEEERKKAEEELTIEMRGLGEMMMKLEEQESRLEEAIRNFDPTIPLQQGLPAGPAEAAEAAVMGSQWIQGIFDQLMQNTPQMPPQAAAGPLFRPEEPQFAPDDMPVVPDAQGMRAAQSEAMDAALSSADFKSSSLEGLIDQSNRLLSTLGDAVNRLDVTSRYA